jgi:hypothetical protein
MTRRVVLALMLVAGGVAWSRHLNRVMSVTPVFMTHR